MKVQWHPWNHLAASVLFSESDIPHHKSHHHRLLSTDQAAIESTSVVLEMMALWGEERHYLLDTARVWGTKASAAPLPQGDMA